VESPVPDRRNRDQHSEEHTGPEVAEVQLVAVRSPAAVPNANVVRIVAQ
jgi:hypothetical protein